MTDGCDPPPYFISLDDQVLVTEMLAVITQHFPHVITVPRNGQHLEAMGWCTERHGHTGRVGHKHRGDKHERLYLNPYAEWATTRFHFAFKNPDDAFEFKMRFG